VLAFESAALVNNVEVTGSVWLTLYVVSDRYDTDFAAQLVDVYPPSADYPSGFAMNIADGIVRARHRFGYSYQGLAAATNRMEQPLPPGARVAPQPGADFDAADPNAPRLLRPGWVHLLAIELFPTANLFTAGHRVRVTVSSSNYPHFDVNPNTPEGGGGQRALEATNAVLHSDLWPSAVWLPVAGCGRCKSDIDLYVTACCPGCEEQRSRQRAQSKL
jgi:putative CocE/NonD family hydrolase